MTVKKLTAEFAGYADSGDTAFARWGDDGDNGVTVAVGIFFLVAISLR